MEDGPAVPSHKDVARAAPRPLQVLRRSGVLRRPGSAIPLQNRPSEADGPHVARIAAPHPRQELRGARSLRRPHVAVPAENGAIAPDGPGVACRRAPDVTQELCGVRGLSGPGHSIPLAYGAIATDGPDVAGVHRPQAEQALRDPAGGLRRPGAAVPLQNRARLTNGPDVAGIDSPHCIEDLGAPRSHQRPRTAVPLQNRAGISHRPDVAGTAAPDSRQWRSTRVGDAPRRAGPLEDDPTGGFCSAHRPDVARIAAPHLPEILLGTGRILQTPAVFATDWRWLGSCIGGESIEGESVRRAAILKRASSGIGLTAGTIVQERSPQSVAAKP